MSSGAVRLFPIIGAGGTWPPAQGTLGCDNVPVRSYGGGDSFSFDVGGGTGREVSAIPAERSPVGGTFDEKGEG
jgi:hypothetical protein